MPHASLDGITLHRPLDPGRYRLEDLVTGLAVSPPLQDVFHDGVDKALENVAVEIEEDWGYMWVDGDHGVLHVTASYWNSASDLSLYLDLVHELVHVQQFREGRELFDHRYKYVARPTEVEAYQVTVREARRLGMEDDELAEFLYVEWIDLDDHRELCATCGVKVPSGFTPPVRDRVPS